MQHEHVAGLVQASRGVIRPLVTLLVHLEQAVLRDLIQTLEGN
jgi:hypothetical protein